MGLKCVLRRDFGSAGGRRLNDIASRVVDSAAGTRISVRVDVDRLAAIAIDMHRCGPADWYGRVAYKSLFGIRHVLGPVLVLAA